jgi:hypothetical protein
MSDVSTFRNWLCYVIVIHWPFGFGQWKLGECTGAQTLRYRIYLALMPYAGSWAYRVASRAPE